MGRGSGAPAVRVPLRASTSVVPDRGEVSLIRVSERGIPLYQVGLYGETTQLWALPIDGSRVHLLSAGAGPVPWGACSVDLPLDDATVQCRACDEHPCPHDTFVNAVQARPDLLDPLGAAYARIHIYGTRSIRLFTDPRSKALTGHIVATGRDLTGLVLEPEEGARYVSTGRPQDPCSRCGTSMCDLVPYRTFIGLSMHPLSEELPLEPRSLRTGGIERIYELPRSRPTGPRVAISLYYSRLPYASHFEIRADRYLVLSFDLLDDLSHPCPVCGARPCAHDRATGIA